MLALTVVMMTAIAMFIRRIVIILTLFQSFIAMVVMRMKAS